MRVFLLAAVALCASAVLPVTGALAKSDYVGCSEHLQSPDPTWVSIATRICSSLKIAASLSTQRDTEDGKKQIHQLYLDTFDVNQLVTHVTPPCIRKWGKLTKAQIAEIVEKEVYRRIASFVFDRPDDFNATDGAALQIGPLGKKPGQLLTKIVDSKIVSSGAGHGDIDITWDFACEEGQCKILDITVYSASLSDQVKASLQSRCHA